MAYIGQFISVVQYVDCQPSMTRSENIEHVQFCISMSNFWTYAAQCGEYFIFQSLLCLKPPYFERYFRAGKWDTLIFSRNSSSLTTLLVRKLSGVRTRKNCENL